MAIAVCHILRASFANIRNIWLANKLVDASATKVFPTLTSVALDHFCLSGVLSCTRLAVLWGIVVVFHASTTTNFLKNVEFGVRRQLYQQTLLVSVYALSYKSLFLIHVLISTNLTYLQIWFVLP